MSKKKKVLLINPPQSFYKDSIDFNVYFPIGLLSIAAVVKKDCELCVYDCLVSDYEVKKDKDMVIYGASSKNIKKAIQHTMPDIVGISIPFSSQRQSAVRIAKIVKSTVKNALVVVGGPDASVAGKDILLKHKAVDMCVQGEGEYVFRQIVRQYQKGRVIGAKNIPGLFYRSRSKIHYTGPSQPILQLDDLPFPEYDLVNFKDYLHHPFLYRNRSYIPEQSISVITSRGCPFGCVFCSVYLHMGKRYRTHSYKYVLRHLQMLITKYRMQNFHFEDDNLTLNKVRFEKILDGIIEKRYSIRWDTPNGVRADTLDYNLLRKMKRSGCASLIIAVESGSQKVLDEIIKKRLDLSKTKTVAKWCFSLKIPLRAFYIIGFPKETKADMSQTITYALRLYRHYDVLPYLFIATPLYGTELYRIAVEHNYLTQHITGEVLSTATQLHGTHLIATDEFSAKDIDRIVKLYEAKVHLLKTVKEWINFSGKGHRAMRVIKKSIKKHTYHSKGLLSLYVVYMYIRLRKLARV